MLNRLRVKNFRLLRDVEIEFDPDLPTVFVGPNASGKSSVLEVLDLIKRCSEVGLQEAVTAHGGIQSIRTAWAKDPVEIEADWKFVTGPRKWHLKWTLAFGPGSGGATIVRNETLTDFAPDTPKPLVVTEEDGTRSVLPESDPSTPSKVTSNLEVAFRIIRDPGRFPGLDYLRLLWSSVSVVGGLAPTPAWARMDPSGASPRDSLVIAPKQFLDRQGLGLANVLYTLFTEQAASWKELEGAFCGEFPFVERLVFPPDIGGSKITFAIEDKRFPGRKLYASELSDGMIAYLCLLASVVHPDQIGILGLDEPDANLHPSALRRLMSIAHKHLGKRKLAIVTHSNALIDHLQDPARSIRIIEASEDGATVRKLDSEALLAWRKEYTVSEMRATGLLDRSNAAYGTEG